MDSAIDAAVNSGVTVIVAAGNDADDAANYTPANSPAAITVSALADFDGLPGEAGSSTCRTDEDDTLANFSNYGTAVDIAAPGVCIYSTYPLERGGYNTISGTSMASPHVAGAAALLASKGLGPTGIRSTLITSGNFNWVDQAPDGVQEPLLDISGSDFADVEYVATEDSGSEGDTGSGGGSGELVGTSQNNGKTWTAIVSTADGTSLIGTWAPGGGTCSEGTCSLSGISKKQSSVDFTSDTGITVTVFK
jgi:subtilisin family serine protease